MSDGFPLRIAVFGPESTGKSTLAQALGKYFSAPVSPEYVRLFWDARDGEITADDLDAIARGQIAGEEAAVAKADQLVFCDTELLTNIIWNDLVFPAQCPLWIRAKAEKRCRQFALYLFCDTDLPFEEDPQRVFGDAKGREMCRNLWRKTLTSRRLPFVIIRGQGQERLDNAITAVKSILHSQQ